MIHEAPSEVVERGWRLILISAGILIATLMQTLDSTIVNVALPIIQGNLGATIDQGAWVFTGYIISAVIVIPLTPWLQMRFGRREYYATAVFGFTAASVCCGLASSIDQLILWRIVQGAFGGGVIATGQAALRDTFSPKHLGASQGVFALGAIVGPTVGPTLGGWLTDNFSWNYCFLINLVPGAIAGSIILTMRNPTHKHRIPLDWAGLGSLALGLGSLQYVLDEGQRQDWFASPTIALFSLLAASGLLFFICWELRGARSPIVDLRALRFHSLWAGMLLSAAIGANLYGAIFLPQFVESILGYTAILSGMLLLVRALVAGLCVVVVVAVVGTGRIDTRLLLGLGFVLLASANLWLSSATTSISPFWAIALPVGFSGLGLALLWIPLSIAVLKGVPEAIESDATAFMNLSLELGGSISTAALVTLLAHREAFHQTILAADATMRNLAVRHAVLHGGLAMLYQSIIEQAGTMAFADVSFVLGALTLGCVPLVLVIQKTRRGESAAHL